MGRWDFYCLNMGHVIFGPGKLPPRTGELNSVKSGDEHLSIDQAESDCVGMCYLRLKIDSPLIGLDGFDWCKRETRSRALTPINASLCPRPNSSRRIKQQQQTEKKPTRRNRKSTPTSPEMEPEQQPMEVHDPNKILNAPQPGDDYGAAAQGQEPLEIPPEGSLAIEETDKGPVEAVDEKVSWRWKYWDSV